MSIDLLLYVVAFLCFAADAAGAVTRVKLQSVGLAFWILAFII